MFTLGPTRLTQQRWLLSTFPRSFDGATDPIDPPENPPVDPDPPTTKPEGWTEDHQKFVNDLIARRERAAKAAGRKAAEDDAKDAREKEEQERKRKADEEKGNYEQARATLERERNEANTKLQATTSELSALQIYFNTQYDAALKDLPEVIAAFKPADDATFTEKSEWLAKAQEQAKKVPEDPKKREIPTDPDPKNPRTPTDKEKQRDTQRMRGYPSF